MSTSKLHPKSNLAIALALILLTACTSPAQNEPTPVPPAESDPTPWFVVHEGARDIAVAYLAENFSLDAPAEWSAEDETPQNLVGSSAFFYTSGDWKVSVQAPVVAPEYLVYTVIVDHVASGLHWEGEVNADGDITETMLTPPAE